MERQQHLKQCHPQRGSLLNYCDKRNSQGYRNKLRISTFFLLILTLIFKISFTEGIRWVTKQSPFYKCKGQDANLTWDFMKEPSEEITQLQWRINGTQLIAYSSAKQGFNVAQKYQGRVDRSGDTGIVLKNISAEDTGNYTFYPLIVWEENPNVQSVWLNVIEPILEQKCTCESLTILPGWRGGQNIIITADGCNLEINSSSFCCPKGLAIEYCGNDDERRCVHIKHMRNHFNWNESTSRSTNSSNLTESTTPSRIVTHQTATTENTKSDHMSIDLANNPIIISILVTNCLCLLCLLVICYKIFKDDIYKHSATAKNKWCEKDISSTRPLQVFHGKREGWLVVNQIRDYFYKIFQIYKMPKGKGVRNQVTSEIGILLPQQEQMTSIPNQETSEDIEENL